MINLSRNQIEVIMENVLNQQSICDVGWDDFSVWRKVPNVGRICDFHRQEICLAFWQGGVDGVNQLVTERLNKEIENEKN